MNGTIHGLGQLSSTQSSALNHVSIPAALRVATDAHMLSALASSALGDREITHFYNAPANKILAFGPMVNSPTLSNVATSPYLRVRAQVPAQAEYATAMSVDFAQTTGQFNSKLVVIITTASFLAGAPSSGSWPSPTSEARGTRLRRVCRMPPSLGR